MIYFYVYPSAFQNPGGGEILLLKTKEYLEKLGVSIKLFDLWTDRLKEGDILHVFGSVKEALGLMEVAKRKRVTIVHSPIIWYNWQSAFRISYSAKERVFCLIRQALKTFVPMVPSERKRMMELADLILASSRMEAEQMMRYFLIPADRIQVVTYGADESFANASPDLFIKKYGLKDFALMVGRIEPRKNQLSLIRAMNRSERILVIIGDAVAQHEDYAKRCRDEAGKNVRFLGVLHQDSEELHSAFAACHVFVLPTWFETPGLAALEAALAGAKVVITREGATREYFSDFVDYVNPGDIGDIRRKVDGAFGDPKTDRLKEYIQNRYLWRYTAEQTLAAYQRTGALNLSIKQGQRL